MKKLSFVLIIFASFAMTAFAGPEGSWLSEEVTCEYQGILYDAWICDQAGIGCDDQYCCDDVRPW